MKVLIISHNSFSKTHNNGKTLSAIFSAFNSDELCQLYFTPRGKPDLDTCKNYFLINDRDALHSIFNRSKCGQFLDDNIEIPIKHTGIRKSVKSNCATKHIRTIIWNLASWYKGGLETWVKNQNPDILFYVGGDSIFSHQIAVSLSKRLEKPLATYFTDDYIFNPDSNIYNRLLKHYYNVTISRSSLLYAIGKKMAADYSSYYNKKFLPIMNIVDIPDSRPEFRVSEDCLHINYFGGLHLGRDKEIIRFAEFTEKKIRPLLTKEIIIGVYTFSQIPADLANKFDSLGVQIKKGLTGTELEMAMQDTDIFLHVESIDNKYRKLTALSVSTKIPEYMCKAKPIMAFGPSEVASFQVISEASDTLVINDSEDYLSNQGFIKHIVEVLNNENLLKAEGDAQFRFAISNFDKKLVAKKFRDEMSQLCV